MVRDRQEKLARMIGQVYSNSGLGRGSSIFSVAATSLKFLVAHSDSVKKESMDDKQQKTKDWVNAAIGKAKAEAETDADADGSKDMVGRLAWAAAQRGGELAAQLDAAIDYAARTQPRLERQVEFVQGDVRQLSAALRGVTAGDATTAQETLRLLDTVRVRLVAARAALQEADNWTTLGGDVDGLALPLAAQRLADARRSLVLLQAAPDYEARRQLLYALLNQLEARAAPQLLDAFNTHDLPAVKLLVHVFDLIHRSNEFSAYYFKSVKAPVLAVWKNLNLDSMDDPDVFVRNLDWIHQIFPTASVANIIKLIHQTFNSLKPSLRFSLERFKDSQKQQLVLTLAKSYNLSITWGINVERELFSLASAAATPSNNSKTTSQLQQPQHQQSLHIVTKKPSISQIQATTAATNAAFIHEISEWAFPILENFTPYQHTYSTLETTFLASTIPALFKVARPRSPSFDNNNSNNNNSLVVALDTVVEIVVPRVAAAALAAAERCCEFTAGYAAAGLVEAVDAFFASVQGRIGGGLGKVAACAGDTVLAGALGVGGQIVEFFDSDDDDSAKNDSVRYSNSGIGDRRGSGGEDGGEWQAFELGVRYLVAVKAFFDAVGKCEGEIVEDLCQVYAKISVSAANGSSGVSAVDSHILSATPTSATETPKAELKTTKNPAHQQVFDCISAVTLLKQSAALNNPALHEYYTTNILCRRNTTPKSGATTATTTATTRLFQKSTSGIQSFAIKTQTLIYNGIFAPINRHLLSIPTLTAWELDADPSFSGTDLGVEAPRFGLSPSVFVTRIGELLLTLPQRFDIHIGDVVNDVGGLDAVEFVVRALPFIVERDYVFADTGDRNDALENGNSSTTSKNSENNAVEGASATDSPGLLEQDDIIHLWITSLSRSTMKIFVANVFRIKKLGKFGARQLATDVDYLVKVLEAMDVDVISDLTRIAEVLDMDENQLRAAAAARSESSDDIAVQVARLCGVIAADG
ncbi:hypothetical protein HK100_000449 [Physocladia obscura]|uniref:Conserved oligomeric Golgi complex subunit 7 n=1 Tax=Physocladia obscura TaxID=109957 RepID=A0AAD5SYD7_9FUNG|nr:hypothetical protein HK100_000449 [Physocladia obscura]